MRHLFSRKSDVGQSRIMNGEMTKDPSLSTFPTTHLFLLVLVLENKGRT